MKVTKVTPRDLDAAYCCMKEIPPNVSWSESLPISRKWLKSNLGRHVEGYHLLDGENVVGHIYYATSERALIPYEIEPEVACIYCTEMLREYMHKGYGRIMFDYMKTDLKEQGLKGILIPATDLKEWMHFELFQKQGFQIVAEHAPFYKVMYFPLAKEDVKVKILPLNYTPSKDAVEVTLFDNFFCPVSVYMHQLIERVAQSFGDKVKIVKIKSTLKKVKKYGTLEPLINGKIKLPGPASEEEVWKAIQEEIDLS